LYAGTPAGRVGVAVAATLKIGVPGGAGSETLADETAVVAARLVKVKGRLTLVFVSAAAASDSALAIAAASLFMSAL